MQIEWIKLYLSILDHRKIIYLEQKYGTNTALGIYIRLILNLAKTPTHAFPRKELPVFACLCKVEKDTFVGFINDCLDVALLTENEMGIGSDLLFETIENFEIKSRKATESIRARWDRAKANAGNTDVKPTKEETPNEEVQHEIFPDEDNPAPTNPPARKTARTPIKKEEAQRVFAHWNSKGIILHEVLKKDWEEKIKQKIQKHGMDDILKAIDNYALDCKTKGTWRSQNKEKWWTLFQFLTYDKGLPVWVDKPFVPQTPNGKTYIETTPIKPEF